MPFNALRYEYKSWPVRKGGRQDEYKIWRFPDKSAAIDFCKANPPSSILFDDMQANIWVSREESKLFHSVTEPPPLFFEDLCKKLETRETARHFRHLAYGKENEVVGIAYTPNHQSGVLDQQLVIKPGRYLSKYFRDKLSDDEIREAANRFNVSQIDNVLLHIGQTREDFRFAFDDQDLRSPSSNHRSCMSYGAEYFSTEGGADCHPAEVYAAGDLHIAYLTHEMNPQRVLARSIIFESRKTHSKIYAARAVFQDVMQNKLQLLGYRYDTCLHGAHLLHIPTRRYPDTEVVMPYIDGRENYIKFEENEKREDGRSSFLIKITEAPSKYDDDMDNIEEFGLQIPDTTYGVIRIPNL